MKIGGRVDALTRVLHKISVSVSKESKAITMNHRYLSKTIIPFQICQIWTCMLFCCSHFGQRDVVTSALFVCEAGLKHVFTPNPILRYIGHGGGEDDHPLDLTLPYPCNSDHVLSSGIPLFPKHCVESSRLFPGHRRVRN